MSKFKKKPVVIEAIQFDGNCFEILDWSASVSDGNGTTIVYVFGEGLKIRTLEGDMDVPLGNWIICGVEREFYSCAPSIFEKTYEAVHE